MFKKIILAVLCVSLLAAFSAEYAAASYEAVSDCYDQIYKKYPSVEAIKKQFGQAKWRSETEPSPHDASLKLNYDYMEGSGIKINTLSYESGGEANFFVTLVDVTAAGITDFLGIDIGSSKDDVIKKFDQPDSAEDGYFAYSDESGYTSVVFTIEKDKVAGMTYSTSID